MTISATIVGSVASILLAAAPAATATPTVITDSAAAGPSSVIRTVAAPHAGNERAAASGTLTIPALRTGRIPVRRVGSRAGAIQIPANVRAVGWWRGSRPLRAREGASVIVGHVSGAGDSPGALNRLPRLRSGHRIVWRVGGQRKVFRVTARTYTRRTGQLPARIWRLDGRRTINLITCARKRVERDGYYHYTHNLTVTAVLVNRR